MFEKTDNKEMGYVYLAKIYVVPNVYITKIGATKEPAARLCNLGKNVRICCISKPHYNYFENEEILHEHYKNVRIPKSLKTKSNVRPELFFISLLDIFKTMPTLNFEQKKSDCQAHIYANGNATYYTSKKGNR